MMDPMGYSMAVTRIRQMFADTLALDTRVTPIGNVAIDKLDVDALKVYQVLISHHDYDLQAVYANVANLLVWLPLLSARPELKRVEVSVFGAYDTNMDVVQFMNMVEKTLGEKRNGYEMYEIVSAILLWQALLARTLQAHLSATNEEEE